jgi:ATP-dependent protease ClpP protease subunit
MERDTFLTAETAKDFGVDDKVIDRGPVEGLPGTYGP